jgi:hypothetical protein
MIYLNEINVYFSAKECFIALPYYLGKRNFYNKQDGKCMCNVAFCRVRATLVAMEKST